MNDQPLNDDAKVIEHGCGRSIYRSAISDDYVAYLQESECDIGIRNDPVSYSLAIKCNNSNKWIDAW